jgi:hypothetical protein
MPPVTKEKTAGMYDRIANLEKDKKVVEAKKVASKFTEEDKVRAKEELDKARAALDDAKEDQSILLCEMFPDNQDEAYLWAHKLKRPHDKEMGQLYDDLKTWIKTGLMPDEEDKIKLFKTQQNIVKVRAQFKKAEKEKNKIWGIIK